MNDLQNTPDPPYIRLQSESGSESIHYSALYEGLPNEFRLRAEKELNETEENRVKGLQRLKEITKQEDLYLLEDHLLLAVLRSCKYNFKKSESKLRSFVAHRHDVVQKVAKVDFSIAERVLDDMAAGILPYRDKHGRFIIFTRPYGMRFEDYNIEDSTSIVAALLLFLLSFELTTVSGLVYFGECKSPTIYIFYPIVKMIRQIVPTVLSYPLRIGKVEILNEFALIRWFLRLISPLLPAKLLQRLSFNGTEYGKLHKLYPPDLLPEEFGGSQGPLSCKFYKEKFLGFISELKSEAKSMDSTNRNHN